MINMMNMAMLSETDVKARLKGIKDLEGVISYHEGELLGEPVEVARAEVRRGNDLEEKTYFRNGLPNFKRADPRVERLLLCEFGLNGRDYETAKGYPIEKVSAGLGQALASGMPAEFGEALQKTRETNNLLCMVKYLAETADEHETAGGTMLQTDDVLGAGYHFRRAAQIYNFLGRIAPAGYKERFLKAAACMDTESGKLHVFSMDVLYAP